MRVLHLAPSRLEARYLDGLQHMLRPPLREWHATLPAFRMSASTSPAEKFESPMSAVNPGSRQQ